MTSTHAEPAQRPPADASITPTSGSTRLIGRVVLGLAALYALVVGVLALLRYESFASDFDHGIFSQYVWLLGHLHEPFNTIVLRTLLGDHVEPGIALLAPLGTLGVGAAGILVVQTLALAATAPLLYLLARESGARGWVAACSRAALVLNRPSCCVRRCTTSIRRRSCPSSSWVDSSSSPAGISSGSS